MTLLPGSLQLPTPLRRLPPLLVEVVGVAVAVMAAYVPVRALALAVPVHVPVEGDNL